jgi:AcrR family transcriptional regulator
MELLSRARILRAALQLVDAEGMDKLSMRRLAAGLGVDPMAIYRHLPDKEAVIAGMVELVFGEFSVPELAAAGQDEGWRGRVRAFATAYLGLAQAHPKLIVYLVTRVDASIPAILAVGEPLVATLRQAGLSPLQCVLAMNLIIDYLHGCALSQSSSRMGQPGEYADFYARLNALPPDRFPAMQAVYDVVDERTLHAHRGDELELILAGIAVWLGELT